MEKRSCFLAGKALSFVKYEVFSRSFACNVKSWRPASGKMPRSRRWCAVMNELGTANDVREKFRSAEAFASWLGLCPDNRISGGRILKTGTRKVANRVANILRLAANSLGRAEGRMGDYVRRFKGRLGKAEGIVAARPQTGPHHLVDARQRPALR